jgi:3-deoxy-D-manno-octulosonic-acid transferase
MGKSFGAGGGQNPLEPARLGCAVATGPSVANFADVVTVLREAEGLAVVADAVTLTAWVAAMLADPAARAAMGARAADAAQAADALPGMLAARLVAVGQQEAGGPRRSPDPPAFFGGIYV